ncbi:MAG: carboxy terminal-processing peptidase, partial [Planctomycetia bacterium]|nr:carboxy terminal-processing peptidase [Planctomycetia bacterium]
MQCNRSSRSGSGSMFGEVFLRGLLIVAAFSVAFPVVAQDRPHSGNAPSLDNVGGPKSTAPVVVAPQIVIDRTTSAEVPSLEGPRNRLIAMQVCELLRSEHLSRHAVDETVAQAAVRQYLDALDPMKSYFYRSDVEHFLSRWREVLQTADRGSLKLATDMYAIFLDRVIEKESMIMDLLREPFEFDTDEEFMYDRDPQLPQREGETFDQWRMRDLESNLDVYPTTPEDAREFWRKRLKYEILVIEADRLSDHRRECQEAREAGKPEPELAPLAPEDEPSRRLERRYASFRKRTENTSADDILETYLCGIMSVYDPHTSYMSPATLDSFKVGIDLELRGIGASLRFVDGYTVVEEVLSGSPASKDGRLRKGDKLLAVGQGDSGPMEDVVDMKLSDVVQKIRGERGTKVRLLIQSTSGERNTLELIRDKVSLKDSQAKGAVFVCGQKSSGAPYRVGVIRLSSFYRDMDAAISGNRNFTSATRDVARILDRFNNEEVDSLVLDFRSNGGGVLEEAIEMTGLFIVDGPVAQLRDSAQTIRPCMDDDPAMTWSKPMIVVVDQLSASATEIFAGAIQDMKRGVIVGDHTTHGKGTVQRLIDLSERIFPTELGAVKVTMQQFFRPGGRSPQLDGIASDVELPSLTSYLDIGERDLKYPLPAVEIPPAKYRTYDELVTPEILETLRRKSAERVSQSEYFTQVNRVVSNYQSQKEKKSISLNREKFLKDREEVDAANARERQIEKLAETEGDIR